MKVSQILFTTLIFSTALLYSCGDISFNRSIEIADGQEHHGDLNSLNGAIIIGKNCGITGGCRSVNGRIEVAEGSTVNGDLLAVNGSISLAENVRVSGDVTSVNGEVDCRSASVKGEVSTMNGGINLDRTMVKYDVLTINGDIAIHNGTVVCGDVIIRRRHGFSDNNPVLTITVSDSSAVKGNIVNRDKTRRVEIILSSGGEVKGSVQNAEVVRE